MANKKTMSLEDNCKRDEQIRPLAAKFDNLQSMVERMVSNLANNSDQQNLNAIAKSIYVFLKDIEVIKRSVKPLDIY